MNDCDDDKVIKLKIFNANEELIDYFAFTVDEAKALVASDGAELAGVSEGRKETVVSVLKIELALHGDGKKGGKRQSPGLMRPHKRLPI